MMARNVDEAVSSEHPEQPTVLVVEDEVLERIWIAGCLREAGFIVAEAATIEEAQIVLTSMPETEAVFSDLVLPSQSTAIELVTWMAEEMPDVPVLLTSGQAPTQDVMTIASYPNVTDFVPKPYSCELVRELLRKRIETKRSAAEGGSRLT